MLPKNLSVSTYKLNCASRTYFPTRVNVVPHSRLVYCHSLIDMMQGMHQSNMHEPHDSYRLIPCDGAQGDDYGISQSSAGDAVAQLHGRRVREGSMKGIQGCLQTPLICKSLPRHLLPLQRGFAGKPHVYLTFIVSQGSLNTKKARPELVIKSRGHPLFSILIEHL